jgi:mannan endo-1,4-beta-mannosidase
MRQKKILFSIISTLFFLLALNAFAFDHFIKRDGDKLKDGEKTFRFIAVNAPNINGHYDGYKNTNPSSGYIYDPMELSYEMEAHFKDMDQMGVTVTRNWGITVNNGSGEFEALVEGPGVYNETAFRRIDKMLELCNRYNIRIILCLVKENKYWGGTHDFANLYGGGDFYKDPKVKSGFKDLLKIFANRKNYYTGVPYKEDKAIMAWEFGNEVPNKQGPWIKEMGEYMKAIAPNQLIADPRRANGIQQMRELVDDVVKNIAVVDIVKTRQYPNYRNSVSELWAECEGKRPMYIDEFQALEGFTEILEEILETGTSGGLLWSLMKPQYNGGIGGHALFHAYSWGGSRWPGFDSGEYFNERSNLMKIREYGYKIRGEEVPPIPAPSDPPYLFESLNNDAAALKWRCSPGARYYNVERAVSPQGPWQNVSGDIDISYDLYFYPLFTDSDIVPKQSYFYRVTGKNESGVTPPSNVVGPIRPKVKMVMDNMADFSITYSHSSNLRISEESWPRLRQTEEDFFQVERELLSDGGEVVYGADKIEWIEVFVFGNEKETLSIQFSLDGEKWSPLPPGSLLKTHREAYPSQISGTKDNPVDKYIYKVPALPQGTSYVKLITGNENAQNTFPWIGRVHLGFIGEMKTR